MLDWTAEEIETLVKLWPTHSAAQIGKLLNRERAAVSGKASRLRDQGVLSAGPAKRFRTDPWKRKQRPPRPMPPKPVQSPPIELAMRPCALTELDDCRCHWPLGEGYAVAKKFCGGDAVAGRRYCAGHLQVALKN